MYVNMHFDALSSFYEKKARTFTSSDLCCYLKFDSVDTVKNFV